jgi:hypothetical protein
VEKAPVAVAASLTRARVAALLAGAVLAACSGSAIHTATYATMAEAREAGAVEQGRVPALLPAAAYELRAAYEIDGDGRWGLFNFRPADEPALRAVLDASEVSVAGEQMEIPPRIEWWPVQLRGRLDEERILATGLRAYRSTDGTLTFLVNWKQGRGYYWRN